MVQGDSSTVQPNEVSSLALGSVLSGGGSDPVDPSPAAWRQLVEGYESRADGVPLLYGIDAVHGHNNVSGAVIFPHNIGLGCTRDVALMAEIGRVTAREVRATSIGWSFAPAISVALDERWGRTYESFSEDPALASEMALGIIRGLQGDALGGAESLLACAKHFAGDGATEGGLDRGNSRLDEAAFRRLAVEPYQPLINGGVGSIMVSYSSGSGQKMSGSERWLSEVLKGSMGFAGFLVSDWEATRQLLGGSPGAVAVGEPAPPPSSAQVAAAINAGLDLLMEPYHYASVVDAIARGPSASGPESIPEARIDDAVARILAIKCELGMLDEGYSFRAEDSLLAGVGSPAHRAVARRAVRESVVVLANESSLLPLAPHQRIHVAGSGADSLRRQCGGWTIGWQGLGVAGAPQAEATTIGTTLLEGIRAVAGAENVSYSPDGRGVPSDADVAILVASEEPYAEGAGDAKELDLAARTPDLATLQALDESGIPVVIVLLSGRPLIIEPYLPLAEAWVAAWLPGSEGAGVADVLFGAATPTGRLGHSWPRTMAQIPINAGDADYSNDPPLYPLGYGLSY